MSIKFHRNLIDFLTDHEKHVSDRQTVAVQDGGLLREPLAKHHPSAKNFMYSTLINPSWISHIAHPLYNHWSYPRFILAAEYSQPYDWVFCFYLVVDCILGWELHATSKLIFSIGVSYQMQLRCRRCWFRFSFVPADRQSIEPFLSEKKLYRT